MSASPILLYGAGGHARELKFQLSLEGVPIAAFVDDFNSGFMLEDVPVLSFDDARAGYGTAIWYVAIGAIAGRREIVAKLRGMGLALGSFVSRRAMISPAASIGGAAQVFANAVISSGVTIADNVIVNFGSVISHDVDVGPNSFIAANVTVAGNVDIGSDVWLGTGAVVRNGTASNRLKIGSYATVGAAACVVSNVADHSTVAGVPAKRKD